MNCIIRYWIIINIDIDDIDFDKVNILYNYL